MSENVRFYLIGILLCLLEYLLHGPDLLLPRLLPGVHLRLVLRQLEEGGGRGILAFFLIAVYSSKSDPLTIFSVKDFSPYLCSTKHELHLLMK